MIKLKRFTNPKKYDRSHLINTCVDRYEVQSLMNFLLDKCKIIIECVLNMGIEESNFRNEFCGLIYWWPVTNYQSSFFLSLSLLLLLTSNQHTHKNRRFWNLCSVITSTVIRQQEWSHIPISTSSRASNKKEFITQSQSNKFSVVMKMVQQIKLPSWITINRIC